MLRRSPGRAHLIAVVALLLGVWPYAARAQASCSFALGFADFVSRTGDLVGDCTEQQRTLAAPERAPVPGYGSLNLQPGDTVQATTQGLLKWNEQLATVEFLTRDGIWRIGEPGLVLTRWTAHPPESGTTSADVTIPEPLRPAWGALLSSRIIADDGAEQLAIGALMQNIMAQTGVMLEVGPLPDRSAGRYDARNNRLTINDGFLQEDPRALASVLAHELTHARQVHAGGGGRNGCIGMEVEGFMAGQLVWTSFWTDQAPPTRTALEQDLTRIAQIAADEGEPGLYKLVVGTSGYQDQCELWVPERSQQAPQPTPTTSVPTAPDPALMSRCPTLAADLAESINRDLPPGSDAGGRAFRALLNLCQMAVQQHGSRGFNCFEGAWRRAIRLNRTAKPGSTAAAKAAEAEYALCVSAR